jgi:hypothetical protein
MKEPGKKDLAKSGYNLKNKNKKFLNNHFFWFSFGRGALTWTIYRKYDDIYSKLSRILAIENLQKNTWFYLAFFSFRSTAFLAIYRQAKNKKKSAGVQEKGKEKQLYLA